MKIIGFPRCALCDKPVDLLEQYPDELRCSIRFRVWCHGAKEDIEVFEESLAGAETGSFGEAFVPTKQLSE